MLRHRCGSFGLRARRELALPGAARAGPGCRAEWVRAARDYANTRLSPDTLVAWIRHPHRFNQVTAMPEMGVGEQEARDIAAYLCTLQ